MPNLPDFTSQLKELQELIDQADDLGETTVTNAGKQIALCVAAGRKLAQFRKVVGHGQWVDWFADNVKGITVRTGQKWTKLAEMVDKGLDVSNAKSVRQAYLLAGILPEPNDPHPAKASDGVTYLVHVDRLQAALRHIDLKQITDEQRGQLATRLKPIAELYASLLTA